MPPAITVEKPKCMLTKHAVMVADPDISNDTWYYSSKIHIKKKG